MSQTKTETLQKIENREAVVGVIGLGYVGLPLAIAFAEAGFRVMGIDLDQKKVDALNRGESYIEDIPSEVLARYVPQNSTDKGLRATNNYNVLQEIDAAIVCVPTPLNKTKDPDMSYLLSAAERIAQRLHPGMVIVLESTTYPGTTEELVLPLLEYTNKQAFKAGRDFYLAFSPERIDPGRKDWLVQNTPKVIGGMTPDCVEVAQALYESAIETIVPVSSPRVAEMVKLLENTFRAVNIALVNEVAIMCDRLDIEVWEVIEAAKTKPFGYMPFYPGPGLGGHCIPIDPEYLAWKLKTLNYNARFIQLAAEVNFGMPEYVRDKVVDALNDDGKALNGSQILILGVAYKENIGDLRESPALDIIGLLQKKGAQVIYNDPYVPELHEEHFDLTSVTLDEAVLKKSDCVIITAAHSDYDWAWITEHSKLVIDTRNATQGIANPMARIVKL
jgi:UDP-N-acetyl-D-glucosamine dehydrogenase